MIIYEYRDKQVAFHHVGSTTGQDLDQVNNTFDAENHIIITEYRYQFVKCSTTRISLWLESKTSAQMLV